MTDTKRPLKVFLCHASADKPKVRELYRTLKRRGVQPWLDAEDLIPGQNWEVEIPKALLSSDAIIICLTPNSVDKEGYVQKEIKFALDKAMEMPEGRIFIIPARLEDCELPFSLRQYQAVNLYEKAGYTKLMQALKLRASQLERATVELPKKGETTAEIKKVVEEKKPPEPKEEKPETKTPKPSQDKVGVGGDVKDSVIVSGSGNVINIGEQKKPASEKPQSKKTKSPRKPNTAIIVALIGLAGTIIAALLSSPLIEKWFSPTSVPTNFVTPPITFPLAITETIGPSQTGGGELLPSLTATTTPDSNSSFGLIYLSGRDNNTELYYLNSGKDRKNLSEDLGFSRIDHPAISPDSRLVAFSTETGIYSLDIQAGVLERLSTFGIKPVWNPNGSEIAFETGDPGNSSYSYTDCRSEVCVPATDYVSKQAIYTISFTSNGPSVYWLPWIAYRGVYAPAWNRDGSLYAYIRRNNVDFICVVYDCIQVKDYVESFDWSPLKNEIVYSVSWRGNFDLYLLKLDNNSQINLTNGIYNNYSPVWNHSGDQIAFVSDRDGNSEIYVMDSTNLTFENITQNIANDFLPLWSPDDSKIIFVSDRNDNLDIFSIDINTREIVNLTDTSDDESFPVIVNVAP